MEKFKKLSKDEMKMVVGGDGRNYQCCTPDYSNCGHCDSSGNGQCQGNGVPIYCIPGK